MAPLLAVLISAALNPGPSLPLRLLTWTSPALPLGAWIAAMAGGGAALSAAATGLALRGGGTDLRRRVRRVEEGRWSEEEPYGARQPMGTAVGGRQRSDGLRWPAQEAAPEAASSRPAAWGWSEGGAGPGREPGQPPPTVAVPFRVIRAPAAAADRPAGQQREQGRQPEVEMVPALDDWGRDSLEEW